MKRLHFIAIGGSAMHSLAIEMQEIGNIVTGSDDVIFEPSKSKLQAVGLLPKKLGWFPEKLNENIDVVVLGMHAKKENPELKYAQKMNLKIQSYPEFLTLFAKNKTRVVIAGSHGKTTITSMILHALKYHVIETDYMVGAPASKNSKTLSMGAENDFFLLEGDEYLSSVTDPQPKFLWYTPEIALISGIAWDHINVFPTFENYILQFEKFIYSIQDGGVLIYNEDDEILKKLVESSQHPIKKIGYSLPDHFIDGEQTYLKTEEGSLPLLVFGSHNLRNLAGAQWIAQLMGLDRSDFYEAMPSFTGALNRLELYSKGINNFLFKDFAHSPSKVLATTKALKKQFQDRKLIAVLELHTFSSLNKNFINQYKDTLKSADLAVLFYDPNAVLKKGLIEIDHQKIKNAFNDNDLKVFSKTDQLKKFLLEQSYANSNLLFMSSGNYASLDLNFLINEISIGE